MSGYGKSDTGKVRTANEDSIYVSNSGVGPLQNLYAVADGMGGHLAGEVASSLAIESLTQFVSECADAANSFNYLDILEKAVIFANEQVYKKAVSSKNLRGMGTTLLAATIKNGCAYVVNVGDSRLYAINKRYMTIKQITNDHSYVMELVRNGKITAEEAAHHPNKNIITRALGTADQTLVDTFSYNIQPNDVFIFCSDGLNNMLSDTEIMEICISGSGKESTVDKLIKAANDRGGADNVSVIMYASDKWGEN